MEDIKSILEELRQEALCNRNEITAVNTNVAKVVTSLEKIIQEFIEMKKRVEEVEKKMNAQEREIAYLSRQERLKNVVITGVPEQQDENVVAITKEILTKSEVSLETVNIDNIFRIGKYRGKRPILLKLNTNLKKQEILRAREKVRHLGFNVFPDRSKNERDMFQKMRPYIMKYRSEGKKVMYRDGLLEMDGRRFTEIELEEMEAATKRKRTEEEGVKGPAAKLKQFAFRSRSSSESAARP